MVRCSSVKKSGYSVPVDERPFTDQVAMLGRAMDDRYSGNVVYEWVQQANGHKLVTYPDAVAAATPTMLMKAYSALSSQ